LQSGSVFSIVVGLYDDLHLLIEGDAAQQLGDIGSYLGG
jgi:hypothetical protein